MPGAARSNGRDLVSTPNDAPNQATEEGSNDIFVNGNGCIRQGDSMRQYTYDPDGPGDNASPQTKKPTLSSGSTTVFANGKPMGRIGDSYGEGNDEHKILTGSQNVHIGG